MNISQLEAILKSLTPNMPPTTAAAELPPLALVTEASAPQKEKEKEKTKKHCFCKRKLTLTDFDCGKCKSRFCAAHRLPEQHACPHDFHKEGQAQLCAANPRVIASKIEQI